MDILIPDSWLRDYLETKATPDKLAECLSLCGPSFERLNKHGKDTVYDIEVTGNRVDTASVYGIAREAAAILPEFNIKATIQSLPTLSKETTKKLDISIVPNEQLVSRIQGVLLMNVSVKESPALIKTRLELVGQRSLNNAIDITNYVMFALGTPLHAFDYDKLTSKKIVVREAKKGEKVTTLDGVARTMKGGEVVFDDGTGTLIDLPGIMGAENTKVDSNTKNIFLLSEHIDPLRIREASLTHELRTHAAVLNEKNVDPESIPTALAYAIELFKEHTGAEVGSSIFDWYPKPIKVTPIKTSHTFINDLLGITLPKADIQRILNDLGFVAKWTGEELSAVAPSYRAHEVTRSEDIVEEIARIYGYFKLPSILPAGMIPDESRDAQFPFEMKIKNTLRGFGGVEIYTLSMVSKQMAEEGALRIKNPLGTDGEYMRTTLVPSLIQAALDNVHEKEAFHLFELSNVYLPQGKKLPVEQMRLAGVFANTEFRAAKGILEALFYELNINEQPKLIKSGNVFTYEYVVTDLQTKAQASRKFTPIPKFPAQIEDMTVVMEENTTVDQVMNIIKEKSTNITNVELKDMYEDAYTFRIHYQNMEKTLTNEEVTAIRNQIISSLKKDLKVSVK